MCQGDRCFISGFLVDALGAKIVEREPPVFVEATKMVVAWNVDEVSDILILIASANEPKVSVNLTILSI